MANQKLESIWLLQDTIPKILNCYLLINFYLK